MKTIVLTGGGTAGHIMPHVALLPNLEKAFDKTVYIGSHNSIEERVMSRIVSYYPIDCAKLRRSFSLKNFAIPFKVFKGTRQAKAILRKYKPSLVFSKGGFVAYPVVRAAHKLRIPVILHESDMTMGLANRLGRKHCKQILTTFARTAESVGGTCIGSPIRQSIFQGDASRVMAPNGKINLLIMGGSLGATKINNALHAALPSLGNYNVIHIAGKGKVVEAKFDGYSQLEYVDNLQDYLAWADIVVSRAGSNAMCELLALKKPALLIPLSTGRGDQIENAKYASEKGAAAVLWEQYLTPETLVKGVHQVWNSREELVSNCAKHFADIDGTERVAKILTNAVVVSAV